MCIIFWVLTALTSTSISNSNSEQVLLGKKELAKLPILLWFLLLFLSYVSPSLEMPKTCSIPEYGCNMPTIPCTTLGRSWFWMWEKSDAKLIECLLAVTYYITSQIKKLCNASHHHFFQRMFLFYAAFYTDMCRCVCVCVCLYECIPFSNHHSHWLYGSSCLIEFNDFFLLCSICSFGCFCSETLLHSKETHKEFNLISFPFIWREFLHSSNLPIY